MLKDEHIELINQTREILSNLEASTLSEADYPYGRFGEACRAADDALFQVLLIARHWLPSEISEREEEAV